MPMQSPYSPYLNSPMMPPTPPVAPQSGLTRFLGHPLVGLATGGLFGWLAQRGANKANEKAQRTQMEFSNRQLALEQQRLADERADMLAARSEDQRRWETEERYKQAVLDRDNRYMEEDRGYMRQQEGRRLAFDPYRQMALARLGRYLR